MDKKKPTLSIVLLYMYVLSKISHTFKPNKLPMASSVDYTDFLNVSALSQSFVLVYWYTKFHKYSYEILP